MNVEKPQVWSGLSRTVLVLASLVIVVAGLKAAQSFFVPVLLAFFVATICVFDSLDDHLAKS